nr:MAG TPA: hypothetical protein [Bacteriophage sp.]
MEKLRKIDVSAQLVGVWKQCQNVHCHLLGKSQS